MCVFAQAFQGHGKRVAMTPSIRSFPFPVVSETPGDCCECGTPDSWGKTFWGDPRYWELKWGENSEN